MLAALSDLALRRPWALLAGNLALIAICVPLALSAPRELGIGTTGLDDSPGELVVLLEGDVPASSQVFAVGRRVIASQLAADPRLDPPRLVSDVGEPNQAVLVAPFSVGSEADRLDALRRLEDRIDPGPLRVRLGGETAVLDDARGVIGGDLWRLELLALPLVLLLAGAVVGPRLAAVPVLAVATGVLGSLAALRVVGLAVDVSLLAVVPATVVAIVLGIELPALVARVNRDEAALAPEDHAVRPTVEAAARPLAAAAISAALPGLALLATPLDAAASLALGAALAAFLAAASTLVAAPAAVAVWGGGPIRGEPGRLGTALRRIPATLAGRRTVAVLAAGFAAGAALALAAPALDAGGRPFAASDLPSGSDAARVAAVAAGAVVPPGGSLLSELPIVAAVAFGLLAIPWLVAVRAPGAPLAAIAALLPAAAGIGAAAFVFGDGHLADLFDVVAQGALDNAAAAAAIVALVAIGAARGALALWIVRGERRLGIGPAGAAELACVFSYPGTLAAGLGGVAASGVLLGADLYAAREFGFAVAVGLAVDTLVLRVPAVAALAAGLTVSPASHARRRPTPMRSSN